MGVALENGDEYISDIVISGLGSKAVIFKDG